MASRKRAFRQKASIRLDEPALVADLAAQNERANWLASRIGLPTIGSRMVNKHGIEWVVQNHAAVPTYDTLHRWRQGDVEPSDDLYPVVAPQNLSPRLLEFIAAIDRCTTKTFAILDTMPGRRKDGHVPGGNSIDTLCHPETNLLFLDAARVHETVIAHEFGHAWVQYGDECEDLRAMEDASDPQRMRMVGFVQSFVQHLKVNDLLRRKGFDMAPIEEDQATSMAQLTTALQRGYEPEHAKEEVFMALLVADEMVRRDCGSDTLVRIDGCLEKVLSLRPPMARLAEVLAGTVAKHGYGSRDSVIARTDECLLAAFEHAGDRIELDQELVLVNPEEPNLDKFPDWLTPLSPRSKCQAGKHMARNDVSSDWTWSLNPTVAGRARVSFGSPEGDRRSEVVLHESYGPPTRYSNLDDMTAELLALKHRNQTGSYQLFGGPPHKPPSITNLEPEEIMRMNEMNHVVSGRPHAPSQSVPTRDNRFMGRPYMAGLGRFLTAARYAEQVRGEKPYVYAMCNPTTYVDPDGARPMAAGSDGMGSNYGDCAVYVCSEKTLPGIGAGIPSHKYVCVTGPGGGCSGGIYPTGGGISPGEIQNRNDSCRSRTDPFRVDCQIIASGCDIASNVCKCVKASFGNPGWYVFPIRTCYTYPYEMIRCACNAIGVGSILKYDICMQEMLPIIKA